MATSNSLREATLSYGAGGNAVLYVSAVAFTNCAWLQLNQISTHMTSLNLNSLADGERQSQASRKLVMRIGKAETRNGTKGMRVS